MTFARPTKRLLLDLNLRSLHVILVNIDPPPHPHPPPPTGLFGSFYKSRSGLGPQHCRQSCSVLQILSGEVKLGTLSGSYAHEHLVTFYDFHTELTSDQEHHDKSDHDGKVKELRLYNNLSHALLSLQLDSSSHCIFTNDDQYLMLHSLCSAFTGGVFEVVKNCRMLIAKKNRG